MRSQEEADHPAGALDGRRSCWSPPSAGVVGLLLEHEDRRALRRRSRSASGSSASSARALPRRARQARDKLPVDPTLAGEIESRYFEEQANGPFYVWAMDTKGDFLFGVPQSAFSKLNAVYDREVTPRLKEGVFLDRQTFLLEPRRRRRRPRSRAGRDGAGDGGAGSRSSFERGQRWQLDRWEPENTFVLSAPLKTADGVALGSLYLKRTPAPERELLPRGTSGSRSLLGVAGGVAVGRPSPSSGSCSRPGSTWTRASAACGGRRSSPSSRSSPRSSASSST